MQTVPASEHVVEQVSSEKTFRLRLIPFLDAYGILIVVFLMIVVLTILEPDIFLTWQNLTNILRQTSVNSMLAMGLFFVILTAGIDLSVGSVMALSMVTLASMSQDGVPWPIAILVPLAVGAAVGLFNGVALTKFRLPHAFIVTLGTLNIARGLTNVVSDGVPISGLPDPIRWLGFESFSVGGGRTLPASLIAVVAVYGSAYFFLQRTRTGRHIYAIGGNPEAALVSGINVNRILVLVYTLSGVLAGLGGLLLAGRTNSGFPNAGLGAELDAIAAVIIGGASFFGGRGRVLGTFAGVLIIGILRNGLNLRDVPAFWQQVVIGAVIILAVYFDVLRREAGNRA